VALCIILTGCTVESGEKYYEVDKTEYNEETGEFSVLVGIHNEGGVNSPHDRDIIVKAYDKKCDGEDTVVSRRSIVSKEKLEKGVYTFNFEENLVDYVKVIEEEPDVSYEIDGKNIYTRTGSSTVSC
jgi:hypothetical protein